MSELNMSAIDLFKLHESEAIKTTINGIDTKVLKLSDSSGNYLAIPATDKNLSKICGKIVLDYLINRVTYDTYNGKVVIIKAYY
ncbi:hypothetical protein [Velocimicrobium porci]|uniref:Uncharacterized protein n=1 Tax=Velocimicrobium porci TaxID=2606634 RepID=A0A6L5Y143_9FIRM|nr:hypothetical protein [Velocimicrobium porci]MSS64567.1 hypothetical protein [Velocimicrobium porci]